MLGPVYLHAQQFQGVSHLVETIFQFDGLAFNGLTRCLVRHGSGAGLQVAQHAVLLLQDIAYALEVLQGRRGDAHGCATITAAC